MPYLMTEVLTICFLTTSLVLNNWAQIFNIFVSEKEKLDFSFDPSPGQTMHMKWQALFSWKNKYQ